MTLPVSVGLLVSGAVLQCFLKPCSKEKERNPCTLETSFFHPECQNILPAVHKVKMRKTIAAYTIIKFT